VADPKYYALVYFTVTGEIVDELPLAALPQWLQQINADGTWTLTTQIGSEDDLTDPDNVLWDKARLWSTIGDSWRYSVAIGWGTGTADDYICQAGPLMSWKLMSEEPPILQLGGAGLWALLRATLQLDADWNGISLGQGGGADTSYTGSLWHIARQIMGNAVERNPMPLDIADVPDGTDIRNYFGYDLVSAGQRLQELTQVEGGPDILLKPYRTSDNHVRHQAMIGTPTIAAGGYPLVFDYPGSATSVLPAGDGSKLSTKSYARGNGNAYTTLWASSEDDTLPGAGWPSLELVDSAHTDVSDQATIQQWADGDQGLNGRLIQTWTVKVKMDDEDYPFGSYDPGPVGVYNVLAHVLLPDGQYGFRILGFQSSDRSNEVVHILQGGSS
jgi:hypothetical protein